MAFRSSRRALRRLTGAVLLPALMAAVGGPLLHECPHHDAMAGASMQGASAPEQSARSGHAAPGAHAADPAHAGDHAEDGNGDGHDGPCTCVGLCHGSSLAPLPALPDAATRVASAGIGVVPVPVAITAIPSAAPYLLPYANGPPGTV